MDAPHLILFGISGNFMRACFYGRYNQYVLSYYLLNGSLPKLVSGFAIFSRMEVSACIFFIR